MTPLDGFPCMAYVRQQLIARGLGDLNGVVEASIHCAGDFRPLNPGETVAVAVGSRRIDRIDEIVHQCLRSLEERGFSPFIVPAMGSHGGATPAGQMEILSRLNITESGMKVPVAADMSTRCIAVMSGGVNIHFSSAALAADHLVVINRVKPHTKFKADIESGLCKMLTIGLGNAEGAAAFHRAAVGRSFGIIETAAALVLQKVNVLFGIALVEDGCGRLAHVDVLKPDDLIDREKKLLRQSAGMMARLPFDDIDILIVDVIGKDISGIGMDSNVTGRHRDIAGSVFTRPRVSRIFVRDLSSGSGGNANGIGLADFTSTRLVKQIDREKTFVNAVTAISPEKGAIPVHFDTDRRCLDACLKTCGVMSPDMARVVRIRDTAHLEYIQISKTFEAEIEQNPDLERVTPWRPFALDASDNLENFDPYEN